MLSPKRGHSPLVNQRKHSIQYRGHKKLLFCSKTNLFKNKILLPSGLPGPVMVGMSWFLHLQPELLKGIILGVFQPSDIPVFPWRT